MIYVMVYRTDTVIAVACVTKRSAKRFENDPKYTLRVLLPPRK